MTAHTLNSFWMTSLWRISMKNLLRLRSSGLDQLPRRPNIDHHFKQFVCYAVLSIAVETSEPLPSKLTSASAAILAFRQCLPSRFLAMDYSLTMCVCMWICVFGCFICVKLLVCSQHSSYCCAMKVAAKKVCEKEWNIFQSQKPQAAMSYSEVSSKLQIRAVIHRLMIPQEYVT
jgi:hypothetical protein